jgi:crotonobetainyl-CoA:carnitine CoA-transferase CaiB-like acyl-CoA transferase
MNGSPWELRRPAPLLGEHTAEVLAEIGIDDERLARLAESGAISTHKGASS